MIFLLYVVLIDSLHYARIFTYLSEPSSIESDAHGIEKLLLNTQESEKFLHIEVNLLIQHYSAGSRWTKQQHLFLCCYIGFFFFLSSYIENSMLNKKIENSIKHKDALGCF